MGSRGPIANPNSQRYQGRNRQKPEKTLADLPADELGTARMPFRLGDEAKGILEAQWANVAQARPSHGARSRRIQPCSATRRVRFLKMDRQIEEDGLMLEGPRGAMRPHPLLGMRNRWFSMFLSGCKDFGLTPTSRQRLKAAPEKSADDPMERFLRNQRPVMVDASDRFDPRKPAFDAKRAFLGPSAS